MVHTFKPQSDSEYICTKDYCGIIFKSFTSASKLLSAYNVVVDSYALCIKANLAGYYCFSHKLRPLEDLSSIVKHCELLLFKPKDEILNQDHDYEDCFYFISQDTLDELPVRELEEVRYV